MKAKTPIATDTLRIVVASLVNSVLMLPSIGGGTAPKLSLRLDLASTSARERGCRPTTSASLTDGACRDRAIERAVSVPCAPRRPKTMQSLVQMLPTHQAVSAAADVDRHGFSKTMYKEGRGTGARDSSAQRWVGFPHPGLPGGAAGDGLRRSDHALRRTEGRKS